MPPQTLSNICKTGVVGLDDIVCGGLPRGHVYLIQGEPGTGKTTLGMQFLMEGVRNGEKVLYITFSETRRELREVAAGHGWNIADVELLELSVIESELRPEAMNTLFHPAEIELGKITKVMLDTIERIKPLRVVFDSVSEMRMLSEASTRFRRLMLALKQHLTDARITVLLLDDLTTSPRDLQILSIVHGVLLLEMLTLEFGAARRRMTISKLRGVRFRGGYHDLVLERGGMRIFPRLIAGNYYKTFPQETISSGVAELDALMHGGLDRGTSTLVIGPAGSGKSTIALQYAVAAAARGEKVNFYSFEENLSTLLARTAGIGMDLKGCIDSGSLRACSIDTAEMSPGEFAENIRFGVDEEGVRMIVLDSLNGYMHAMPQEQHLMLQLHELFAFLNRQGVVTIVTLAQQGLMGPMQTPIDVTYLADSVIVTRYFEANGAVKKALSVVKKRSGAHEDTIRAMTIDHAGLRIGEPLKDFRGVMTGVPVYLGAGGDSGAPRAQYDNR